MNQQFEFSERGYSITIKGTGAVRASVANGTHRYVKFGRHIYGKRIAVVDRITDAHAILSMSGGCGTPFVAREDETCAQALMRFHTERAGEALQCNRDD